jgi:hypothetical protein
MSRKVINVVTGGSSNIKYYDISSLSTDVKGEFIILSILRKSKIGEEYIIGTPSASSSSNCIALGFDFEAKIYMSGIANPVKTIKEVLIEMQGYDILMSCPELTEEQFYDLTLPTE